MQTFRKRTRRERFWEILPGLQFWSVFFLAIFLSFAKPVWAAIFIVCFDLYWLLKAMNTALHLIYSYRKFRIFTRINWLKLAESIDKPELLKSKFKQLSVQSKNRLERKFYLQEINKLKNFHQHSLAKFGSDKASLDNYYQLVIIPFVDESFEVLDTTIDSLTKVDYPKDKIILLLASEERAGQQAQTVASEIVQKYGGKFFDTFVSVHPDGLPEEIKGKSANASFAVQSYMPKLKQKSILPEQVLVSNLDSDTVLHPQYFGRVMYEFLTQPNPYQKSYQPIAIYNNNIWDSPAFIRVVSVSNSFWQFTESSRPDRLRTFSSHTMTLKALIDVGFWKKDIINEDGYIFWQCYLHYKGEYEVVPLFLPVSLDTCLAPTFWQTLKNQYKQKKRWAYNVEYYPHLIPALLKAPIPWRNKFYKLFQYVEGNFNWATASLLITILGWMPLIVGGPEFTQSVLAYNLPRATRTIMTTATAFLIFSVYINLILLPPRPKKYGPWKTISMYLQWALVPLTSILFGSLPAIEAQTRLMLGYYLEFWVTPKARKGEVTALNMEEMKGSAK